MSPTNWIIASNAMVHVGDVVVVENGRARITGVGANGYPILTYVTGVLAGSAFATHPQHIQAKAEPGIEEGIMRDYDIP